MRILPGVSLITDERYPTALPESDIHVHDRVLEVPLARLEPDTVERFVRIELPERPTPRRSRTGGHTIGQFSEGIALATDTLHDKIGPAALFNGPPARQIGPEQYGGGAGTLFAIAADDPADILPLVLHEAGDRPWLGPKPARPAQNVQATSNSSRS